jgi:hypothetical protein
VKILPLISSDGNFPALYTTQKGEIMGQCKNYKEQYVGKSRAMTHVCEKCSGANRNYDFNRYVHNPYNEKLEHHEQCFYKSFANENRYIEIIARDRSVGCAKPTNDFTWNNKEFELKSPTASSYKNIERIIRTATKKNKRNIMLDLARSERSIEEIIKDVEEFLRKPRNIGTVDELFMFKEGELYKIDKDLHASKQN